MQRAPGQQLGRRGAGELFGSTWSANTSLAGGNGRILHYDGSAWTTFESGTGLGLESVWASGPHDVWVVGNDGAVLHRRR